MKKIKVLIVDDSSLVREILSKGLSQDENLEIVGAASDPFVARDMILKYRPDVMTLDIEMPRMNGLEFLSRLMPQFPIPTTMVSSLTARGANETFRALELGAIDFILKPSGGPNELNEMLRELSTKIKIASTVGVSKFKKHLAPQNRDTKNINTGDIFTDHVIAIGASTGGTEAIPAVIKDLPNNLPGILITQHMPKGFTTTFANRLNQICLYQVKEAEDGDKITNGLALLAPGDYHMQVLKKGNDFFIKLIQNEKVSGHRPSVDVMLNSVAENYGSKSMGIILTGMGKDGAQGLKLMKDKGAFTIGQDENSSIVYGMPQEALKIGAVEKQMPLLGITSGITSFFNK